MSAGDFGPIPGTTGAPASFPIVFGANAPVNPYPGMAWQDTTTNQLKAWDGTTWQPIGGGGGGAALPAGTSQGQILQTGPAPYNWRADDAIDCGRF